MATLSELNKKERSIRGKITSLKSKMRKKKITKREFDKDFERLSSELEMISEQKAKLIGLPPLPPPPKPGKGEGRVDMDSIKKVVEGESIDPPGPPVVLKQKKAPAELPKPPKAEKPVKEKIREVKVPVVKEKIKEVPVIKTVKVPTDDPKFASKIESNFKDMSNIKIDVARQDKEFSQAIRDIKDLKKEVKDMAELKSDLKNMQVDLTRNEQELSGFIKEVREVTGKLASLDEMRSEVQALKARLSKIDFQGLSQEIYKQFEQMNQSIKESDKKTDDSVEKLNVELKTIKEKMADVEKAKEHLEKLDLPNIKRDMEVLKQKSQHLEGILKGIDVGPITDMLKDVEDKVSQLHSSSALIIE